MLLCYFSRAHILTRLNNVVKAGSKCLDHFTSDLNHRRHGGGRIKEQQTQQRMNSYDKVEDGIILCFSAFSVA